MGTIVLRESIIHEDETDVGCPIGAEGHKSLEMQGLALHDGACHALEEVHPRGFEPLTFGSVGQFFIENSSDAICCKILENLGFPVNLRTIVLLPTFQILQRFALRSSGSRTLLGQNSDTF